MGSPCPPEKGPGQPCQYETRFWDLDRRAGIDVEARLGPGAEGFLDWGPLDGTVKPHLQWLRSQGMGPPGPQLEEEVWDIEGIEVCRWSAQAWGAGVCHVLEKSTEGIPGTVSPQGHLGPGASDSQTSMPGLLWSGTVASRAAGSTCAVGRGWCSLRTAALACLTTSSSTSTRLSVLRGRQTHACTCEIRRAHRAVLGPSWSRVTDEDTR